jgi:hypothetical protein
MSRTRDVFGDADGASSVGDGASGASAFVNPPSHTPSAEVEADPLASLLGAAVSPRSYIQCFRTFTSACTCDSDVK